MIWLRERFGHTRAPLRSDLCRDGHHLECAGYRKVLARGEVGWRPCHCPCGCARRVVQASAVDRILIERSCP